MRNSASRWPLLSEYITMHGPLNVKCGNEPSDSINCGEFLD